LIFYAKKLQPTFSNYHTLSHSLNNAWEKNLASKRKSQEIEKFMLKQFKARFNVGSTKSAKNT